MQCHFLQEKKYDFGDEEVNLVHRDNAFSNLYYSKHLNSFLEFIYQHSYTEKIQVYLKALSYLKL